MEDAYGFLANAVVVIRSDNQLRECFNRILGVGSMTQQVRVAMLLKEMEKLGAPDEIKKFVRLLSNDKLAHQVLKEINNT
ncbi:MAG: hypothetical protein AB7G93_00135 [Bdellovibrionales bacterium]